jgi:hypothetical protein
MTASTQPRRFKVGDEVQMDTGDYRFAGRTFKVREIVRGKYQLDPTDGGPGVRDVSPRTLIAPGEPLKSGRWLHVGTIVRYVGDTAIKHKTTVILAPGDFGVVIATKGNTHGGLTVNVARYGALDQDAYARLSPLNLDVVPVTDEMLTALAAADTAAAEANNANANGAGS